MDRKSKIAFTNVNLVDRVDDDPVATRVPISGTLITITTKRSVRVPFGTLDVIENRTIDFNRRMNDR